MTVEEAIRTAIQYENRVVAVYEDAVQKTHDPTGKKVFETLVREEKNHVSYLEAKLQQWKTTGHVTAEGLETVVPSPERIEAGVARLEERLATQDRDTEFSLLKKALDSEVETSQFYKGLVRELPPEHRGLFERFVEIEEGHEAIVQAEMDSVSGLGFWFDIKEFSLEGE